MAKISELIAAPTKPLKTGNFACTGCGMGIAYNIAISALENPIIVIPASCASVIQSLQPKVCYNVPTLNIAFAAHAAAATGISRAKKRMGEKADVCVWAGDGSTFDIGISTLSGAAERNEDIIFFVYNNEFYGNTGSQRSGATPRGAVTTTTPLGKRVRRKSIERIMAGHNIPYLATASIGYVRDLYEKVRKASKINGFKFIHIYTPCPTGWDFDPQYTVKMGELAVKTGFLPMFEIENGVLTFDKKYKKYANKEKRLPLNEFIKYQGRFSKISKKQLGELQNDLDSEWESLGKLQ